MFCLCRSEVEQSADDTHAELVEDEDEEVISHNAFRFFVSFCPLTGVFLLESRRGTRTLKLKMKILKRMKRTKKMTGMSTEGNMRRTGRT